jgi:two-component system, OmpR family, heavy metal sensor histidine kinase CusS
MYSKILTSMLRWRGGQPQPPSLALMLAVWYTASSFLIVAAITALLYFGLAENLRKLSEQIMADELDVCRALIQARSNDSHALREEVEIDSAVRRYQKFYIRVMNDSGRALFTTPGMDREMSAARIAREAAQQNGRVFWLKAASGKPYRAVVARVSRDSGDKEPWNIQLTMDLSQEVEVLSQHRILIWIVLALAAILCPRAGIAAARWGTRPLREVSETARSISSSTLNERIRTEGYPSEIASLAGTFNAMLQRLEDSFVRLSRFSADIAHELRTPVNNIRGESEVALARPRTIEEYRETLGSCLEESVRLSELIESLLFLARSESPGDHLKRTRQNIGTLLSSVQEYYDAAASEAGVRLHLDCEGEVIGDVDGPLLQRALGNLVSNALAHTPAGGTVLLTAVQQSQHVRIEVRDTGSGIPSESLPKVFDRFYRADSARTRHSGGSGLGLSIMRQIVFLHGGDVKIESETSLGTTVSLTLPSLEP